MLSFNWFRLLLRAQVAAILGLGIFTAFNQPFYARIDERAHLSYIETVATQGRLPVLGRDCIQGNLVPLQPDYVGPRPGERCNRDMNAASYEAFQPPLYYVLAAPIFRLPVSVKTKAIFERLFNLLLFALTIGLVVKFISEEFPVQGAAISSVCLAFFCMPGIIMRMATIGNASMEVLMATVFLISLWAAFKKPHRRRFILAGAALGLAILTKTSLAYLVLLYLIAWAVSSRGPSARNASKAGACGLLIAGLLVAPWIAFNKNHFGTMTADKQAQMMQLYVNNPAHRQYTLTDLITRAVTLVDIVPEEWEPRFTSLKPDGTEYRASGKRVLLASLISAFVVGVLLESWARRRVHRRYFWFAVPVLLTTIEISAVLIVENQDSMLPRFLFPSLAPLAILLAISLLGSRPGRRFIGVGAALVTLGFVGIFVFEARHGLDAGCCLRRAEAPLGLPYHARAAPPGVASQS